MNNRSFLVYRYFKELNYEVKIYTANFNHYTKDIIKNKKSYITYVNTIYYKKNISLKRILSHIIFSIKVSKLLKKEKNIDILYVNMPPNILGYLLSKKDKKVIIDIIDLWPEALPFPKYLKNLLIIFLNFWKYLRKVSIENGTYILTHTHDFYNKLELYKYRNSKVISLKKYNYNFLDLNFSKKEIRILYLGNISYIYDFDSLIYMCEKLKSFYIKVIVEIIGDGPLKENLLNRLKNKNIDFLYHGIIFEEKLKERIVSRCQFGYNGYKEETDVSLSYKSIDYFSYGLPIINSAKGDTWTLMKKYKSGYNFNKQTIDSLIHEIKELNKKVFFEMQKNCKRLFLENFSFESYKRSMDEVKKYFEKL